MSGTSTLPTFESWLDEVARCERADGWLIACADEGRFLAPSRELVEPLAALLGKLAAGQPVLEVCSGGGDLAEALMAAGLPLRATDAQPPAGSPVERLTAPAALNKYRPHVVLGAFVPVDAGVDEAVVACPSVRHYVVLGARIGGLFGSAALWRNPQWQTQPLPQIARWMLTRHDVWLDNDRA